MDGFPLTFAAERDMDDIAFERIVREHEKRVYMVALRLLGRAEDAQDAAQEAFMKLHRHLRKFADAAEIRPWLYRVTVNVCNDIARKRRPWVPLADIGTPPADDLLRAEQKRIVEQGLLHLPVKERAAIVLREIEGLTTTEVAEILGSSEETVRSQVSTGKTKLKQWVEERIRRRS